jgi:hypothetical protein
MKAILKKANDKFGFSLLCSVVMVDETWCFQYDPQTKRQSMEHHLPSSAGHNFFIKKRWC